MKPLLNTAKWLATGGILWWIFRSVEVAELTTALSRAHWLPIGGTVVLAITGQLIAILRWRLLAANLDLALPASRAVRIHFTAICFCLFLPGGALGVDAIRAWGLSCYHGGGKLIMAGYSVIVDRINGLFGLVALALTGSWLLPDIVPDLWRETLNGIALALIAGWLFTPLLIRLPWLRRSRLGHLVPAQLEVFWQHPTHWWVAALLAAAQQAMACAIGLLLDHALQLSLPPLFYLYLMPTTVLFASLPITIGGHGLREGLFVHQMGWLGVAPPLALAFGLLYLFSTICMAILGGFVFLGSRGILTLPPRPGQV